MDPFVELAQLAIEQFTRHHRRLVVIPEHIRKALEAQQAATFVSIHTASGELRGCKGTLEPWHASVLEEIIHNAISACSQDNRFSPVREDELAHLEINVDVLSALEPIQDPSQLDVKRYGVLVSTQDGRRGVLLPDLETVETVEEQITIACRKAGIHPKREAFTMQRFTTTRHQAS